MYKVTLNQEEKMEQQYMAEFHAKEENILWYTEFVLKASDFEQTKKTYLAASMEEKEKMLTEMEETIENNRVAAIVDRDMEDFIAEYEAVEDNLGSAYTC